MARTTISTPLTVTQRVNQHRERMREAGLKKVELWVPDFADPGFAREARRQSRAAASEGTLRITRNTPPNEARGR